MEPGVGAACPKILLADAFRELDGLLADAPAAPG